MTTTKKHTLDLTQGSVPKQLIAFFIPIFFTNLLQQLYTAADQIVVGQFAGELALAAVGSTYSPTNLLLQLVIGLATGANVIIANFRGAKDAANTRNAMHTSMVLALLGGAAMLLIGVPCAETILRWMGSPEDTRGLSSLYMQIIFCGTPFSMIYNFGSAVLRAHGETRRPMMILSLSGILNVVLNVIFVVFFHMSVAGVALATVISQGFSAGWVVYILMNPNDIYGLRLQELKLYTEPVKLILRTGIPCGINTSLINLSGIFLQSSVNSFGSVAMAGVAASDSLTNLSDAAITSIAVCCTSFSGQCFGAKMYKRIDRLILSGLALGTVVHGLFLLMYTLLGVPLHSIYTDDPEVLSYAISKTTVIAFGYFFSSAYQVFIGALRGMRISGITTVLSVFCLCVLRLLWIFLIFPMNPQISFLYLSLPFSYLCNLICQGIVYFFYRKKLLTA